MQKWINFFPTSTLTDPAHTSLAIRHSRGCSHHRSNLEKQWNLWCTWYFLSYCISTFNSKFYLTWLITYQDCYWELAKCFIAQDAGWRFLDTGRLCQSMGKIKKTVVAPCISSSPWLLVDGFQSFQTPVLYAIHSQFNSCYF